MERSVVGARELKTRLGTYLRRGRAGRTVLLTDRGRSGTEAPARHVFAPRGGRTHAPRDGSWRADCGTATAAGGHERDRGAAEALQQAGHHPSRPQGGGS